MSELELQQLESLFDEFQEGLRRDPSTTVSEFAARHPQQAADIVALFPLMSDLQHCVNGPVSTPRKVGDYRVVRLVGVGGMGVVYEVESEALRGRLAAKVVKTERLVGKKRDRFKREAMLAASLHHSRIVPIYELRETDGQLYYTMRLIDGPNLAEVLHQDYEEHEPLAESDLQRLEIARKLCGNWKLQARLVAQVADAIAYAHNQGILHRDVKPANLLLDSECNIWVTDFGLAKHRFDDKPITVNTKILGTPRYMAPEQIRGDADERSDIFGLGMVLYEMAIVCTAGKSGRRPIWKGGLQQPTALNPEIPEPLEELILRAVALDPRERYNSAEDFADDLRRFAGGAAETGTQTSPPPSGFSKAQLVVPTLFAIIAALGLGLSARAAKPGQPTINTKIATDSDGVEAVSERVNMTQLFPSVPSGTTPIVRLTEASPGPWAVPVADQEFDPYNGMLFHLSGTDQEAFAMTPQGVFALNPLRHFQREYTIDISVERGAHPRFVRLQQARNERWSLVSDQLVSDASIVSTAVCEAFSLAPHFIDLATADGVTYYHFHESEVGIALYRSRVEQHKLGDTALLNLDCGLPLATAAIATVDGIHFAALIPGDGPQKGRLLRCSLQTDGSFSLTSELEVSLPQGRTYAMSWLDSNRFLTLQSHQDGTTGVNFSFVNDEEMLHMPLDQPSHLFESKTLGHAAWVDYETGSTATQRTVRVEFTSR